MMKLASLVITVVTVLSFSTTVHGFVEGLYCGTENCYDILGVTRDTTKGEISRAYRKLARKIHPDVNRGDANAAENFRKLATAYEILKDEEQRKDYDYMLDNPEEAYYHYYRYYKRRMTPKVDVRIVLAVTITIVSVLQYLQKVHRYDEAVNYAMQNPKFRNQALEIIHSQGLYQENNKKAKNKKSKEERKREEERILKEVVEDSIDIRGGYGKPSYADVLWVQLCCLPYYAFVYMMWFIRWVWKFWILKQEYGDKEKAYLTYKGLSLSANYWKALDSHSKQSYLEKELWKAEKLKEYKEALEEEYRVKMAESGRHKMWRRYMKKGGPGQMTFMEE